MTNVAAGDPKSPAPQLFIPAGWKGEGQPPLYTAAQVAALKTGNHEELAHELFAAAQLAPGEGIEDAVSRIAAALTAAPVVQAEPLHITHGPLMRHAAALLRSRKPALPEHESVADELEKAADGRPTPSGEPSEEWLEVARLAAAPTKAAQAAPVGVDRYAATLKAQNDQFEHALAELVDLVCPGLDSGNLLVDAKTAGDAAQALRADRAQSAPAAQADSITKERLKELLGKPETVHLNMLHGHIAVITMEQCAHLHGEEMQRKWAAADSVLKDHQIAALVNELRDIAVEFKGTQQLRERIAQVVVPALKAQKAERVLEDAGKENICIDCTNADSWGLPDKSCCQSCVASSNWQPLNRSSVHPNAARKQGGKHD